MKIKINRLLENKSKQEQSLTPDYHLLHPSFIPYLFSGVWLCLGVLTYGAWYKGFCLISIPWSNCSAIATYHKNNKPFTSHTLRIIKWNVSRKVCKPSGSQKALTQLQQGEGASMHKLFTFTCIYLDKPEIAFSLSAFGEILHVAEHFTLFTLGHIFQAHISAEISYCERSIWGQFKRLVVHMCFAPSPPDKIPE